MPTVKVNDARLYYEEYGTGDEVVISSANGFTGWAYPEMLAEDPTNYRVITIQTRGFGKSSHVTETPEIGWLAQWADDVCAVASRLGVDRFIYTGASHGAGIGWYIARRAPERLKALVSVVGTPHDRAGGTDSSESRRKLMEGRHDPDIVREHIALLGGWSEDPVRLAEREITYSRMTAAHMNMPESEAWINQGKPFPEADTDGKLEAVMGEIDVPVLIVAAMRDGVISPESALRGVRSVRRSKAVFFEDEGHHIGSESPERIAREVKLYVDELNDVAVPRRPIRPAGLEVE